MDTQSVYDSITEDVKNGAIDSVFPKVESILAEHPHDPMEHIKCASLLKSIDLESECQGILDRVVSDLPEDPAERQAVAVALRNLGRSEEAFDIVRSLPEPDPSSRRGASPTAIRGYSSASACAPSESMRPHSGRPRRCTQT